MYFINPVDTITSLGKSAVSAGLSSGFNKLREHFGLTSEKLKESATARNLVLGTLAASGVAAVMINPVTRVALCTLISMIYSMSLITLNLMMIGLYLSWMGMKGVGAVATTVAPMMKKMAQDFMSGYNDTVYSSKAADSFPKPSHTPDFNPQEAAKEFKERFSQSRPHSDLAEEFVAEYTGDGQGESTNRDTSEKGLYKDVHSGRLSVEDDVLDQAWLEEFGLEQQTVHSTGNVPKLDVEEFLKWESETRVGTGTNTGNQWVSEFAKQTGSLTGLRKHVSLPPGTNGVEDWAAEFAKQQTQGSGPSLWKYAGGALVVGAGVYAAWKFYKTMQELKPEEENTVESGVTYASISRDDIPDTEEDYTSSAYDHVNGNFNMFGFGLYE